MLFYTISSSRTLRLPTSINSYPCVVLMCDDWDDHGFKTTFHAYWLNSKDDYIDLGCVKILDKTIATTKLPSTFESLSLNYCSLGQSLNYYCNLKNIASPLIFEMLKSLNDMAYDNKIYSMFQLLEGVNASLFRFSEASRAFKHGRGICDGTIQHLDELNFKYKTTLSGANAPHVINIIFSKKSDLPIRLSVIIGKNGTGKTEFLARLVRTLVEPTYKDGILSSAPLISRVIAVSYNPFDCFIIPTTKEDEDRTSYKYCGLRNMTKIFSQKCDEDILLQLNNLTIPEPFMSFTDKYFSSEDLRIEMKDDNWELSDGFSNALIKHEDGNIVAYMEKLLSPAELYPKLRESMNKVSNDFEMQVFARSLFDILFCDEDMASAFVNDSTKRYYIFSKMSAGQRIVAAIVADVCAFIVNNSFIVIDEPENHLHPGLLSSLLTMLHKILKEKNSFALIATHSPVVLQQIPSEFVTVFDRVGNSPIIHKLDFECFGENLETITEKALGLSEQEIDYKSILDDLLVTHTPEEVNDLFNGRLGLMPRLFMNSVDRT